MWGRNFFPGGEILGLLRIFVFVVFVANRSALAKESVVYSVGGGYGQGLQGDGVVFELGCNFLLHATPCWRWRDQPPLAGDQWLQPPIT
jgi:hypothetical protein